MAKSDGPRALLGIPGQIKQNQERADQLVSFDDYLEANVVGRLTMFHRDVYHLIDPEIRQTMAAMTALPFVFLPLWSCAGHGLSAHTGKPHGLEGLEGSMPSGYFVVAYQPDKWFKPTREAFHADVDSISKESREKTRNKEVKGAPTYSYYSDTGGFFFTDVQWRKLPERQQIEVGEVTSELAKDWWRQVSDVVRKHGGFHNLEWFYAKVGYRLA